jgi:hypothetical protein
MHRTATSFTIASLLFLACTGGPGSPIGTLDAGAPDRPPFESPPITSPGPARDAAAPEAGLLTDAGCTDCIAVTLSWGENGGLVQYVDTSSLAPCHTFARTRSGLIVDGGPSHCTTEIGACSPPHPVGEVAVGDVEAALVHPDVVGALAATTTPVYGVDSRAVDGAVFRITVGTKSIDVGSDCGSGPSSCVPAPAGVKTLQALLQHLDEQELAKPACAAFSR